MFRNRRGNCIKVLLWDGTGVWLCQRRLHEDHESSLGVLEDWEKDWYQPVEWIYFYKRVISQQQDRS